MRVSIATAVSAARAAACHVAGGEQRHGERRTRVDAIEVELEPRVDRVGLAQIRERLGVAALRLAQARAFRQRVGSRRLAPRQQDLRQQLAPRRAGRRARAVRRR